MEVHFKRETELRLDELSAKTGRPKEDLVEDAMAGYLVEVEAVRNMLDTRYEDAKAGHVKPIDGETFFEGLRRLEDEKPKQ